MQGWPKIALLKSLVGQRTGTRVITAVAAVNFVKNIVPLFGSDALEIRGGVATFV